jgi:hypothetical protein
MPAMSLEAFSAAECRLGVTRTGPFRYPNVSAAGCRRAQAPPARKARLQLRKFGEPIRSFLGALIQSGLSSLKPRQIDGADATRA